YIGILNLITTINPKLLSMNIGLDIMGGDFAPEAAIKGALMFLQNNTNPELKLTLVGNESKVTDYMHLLDAYNAQFKFIHAPSEIEMNEHPTKALKEKQD